MANERSSQLTGYRAGDFVRLVVAALALALARKRQRDQAVGRRRRAMPPAFGENRAGGPLREREPAAVLERVHETVDRKCVHERRQRCCEGWRMGKTPAAYLAARRWECACRTRGPQPRQGLQACRAQEQRAGGRGAELAALRQRTPRST